MAVCGGQVTCPTCGGPRFFFPLDTRIGSKERQLTPREPYSYFTHLNTTVAVLDPVIHTHEWIYNKNRLLYTAVLCAAAKILRPKVYASCLQIANRLLGKVMEFGMCNIEVVQSILILCHWKKVGNGVRWLILFQQ